MGGVGGVCVVSGGGEEGEGSGGEGGRVLVVVQIRLVGHSLAEMKAAVCIVFEITN